MKSTQYATFARTLRMWRAYQVEQSDPDHCYQQAAADAVEQLQAYTALQGKTLLDVGGGPGYFAAAFEQAGARYAAVDPSAQELVLHGRTPPRGTIRASGLALPFPANSFGITYSSNVVEHVPQPWRLLDQMVDVTCPGGLIYVSFTTWLGPHGGHETAPWHYFGGHFAARRYQQKTGRAPKNQFGQSLFAVTVSEALRWAKQCRPAALVHAIPRYHPRWAHWVVHVPILREVATWNLVLVLRKR